jgi:hypothetical protein
LAKRSLLSHTYNERTAEEAERLIKNTFAPAFRALYDRLHDRRT